ncbi:MAG: efflux RND transporter periplasmic adaptor subunit [Planctomycetes bacterium]|nr:efflux RND transporter periplasmic adaptor subunit [Planctomycetota bacterium]
MRKLVWILALPALLLAACGGGSGDAKGKWGGNEPEVERKDPLVEVVPALKDNISSFERSTGRIEAKVLADVHAQVGEICLEILHDVGDEVREGELLARLDRDRIQIQLTAAMLALEETRLTHRRNQLDAEKKKADLERIEKYFDPDNPDKSRVFTKDAWDAAKLENSKAINTVQSSQLALTKAEGELAVNTLQLKHTEIRAPITGVITERNLRANELVSQGAVIFKLADLTVLEVKLDIAEAGLSGLRQVDRAPAMGLFGLAEKPNLDTAQAVLLSVTAYPDDRFLGYLDRISPVVDQTRGMVVVTVRILQPRNVDAAEHKGLLTKLDPDARKAILATAKRAGDTAIGLRPGMWVDAKIATRLIEGAILVPGAALVGDAEIIWKIEPDKKDPQVGQARRVDVQGRRGLTAEGKFELKPPIAKREDSLAVKAGDLIVVRGQSLLREGQKVRLRDLSK